MKEVYNFLDSLNITNGDILIIGVSFGPDSMFLLDLLKNKYKDNKNSDEYYLLKNYKWLILKNEENIKHISSFILNDGNGCMRCY